MNILQTAIRRILVRSVDRSISTAGRNAAYDWADYNPSLPTWGRLIKNVIWFGVLTYIIAAILVAFDVQLLAYLTPLLFVRRIFRPLAYNHIYGQKQEAVLVRDRRYKSGARTEGYKMVKDLDNRIEFTSEQIKISKIEGLLKLLITCLIVFYVYTTVNSADHKVSNLSQQQVKDLLKPGDTLFLNSYKAEFFIKVKETNYYVSRSANKKEITSENVSYESAFTDSSKILGRFVAIDTSKVGFSSDTYLSLVPFNTKGFTYQNRIDSVFNKEVIRVDSLFYLKLSAVTVSTTKLPPIK